MFFHHLQAPSVEKHGVVNHTCRVDHLQVEVQLGHSAPHCDGQFFEGLRLQNVVLFGDPGVNSMAIPGS